MGAALFALGCGLTKTQVSLTNADNGRSIAVVVGDEIDVTLQTIGPGEYGTPVLSSRSIRFLGVSYPGPQNPGGPRQLFRFEAVVVGRAEITMTQVNRDPLPPISFAITIEVR